MRLGCICEIKPHQSKKKKKKILFRDFPGSPVVETSNCQRGGAQVQFLVRELRCHMLCGTAKRQKTIFFSFFSGGSFHLSETGVSNMRETEMKPSAVFVRKLFPICTSPDTVPQVGGPLLAPYKEVYVMVTRDSLGGFCISRKGNLWDNSLEDFRKMIRSSDVKLSPTSRTASFSLCNAQVST